MKLTTKNLILLLLLFSLVLLSACAQKPSESDTPDTTAPPETSAEPVPETNLDDLQFVLEMPSKELQERFVNEYKAFMAQKPHSEEYQDPKFFIGIDRWYGSFGDIHFLFIDDGNLSYLAVHTTDDIADCNFSYPDSRRIMVWVNGQFLSIETAYKQNLITKNMVETVANLHNGTIGKPIDVINYTNHDYYGVSPEVLEAYNKAISSTIHLDARTIAKIKSDYKTQFPDSSITVNNYNKLQVKPGIHIYGYFCYGVFENCTVIFEPGILTAISAIEVAGHIFKYGDLFNLYAYCNGTFYDLKTAYENGYITEAEVGLAAERHLAIRQYNELCSLHNWAKKMTNLPDDATVKKIETAFANNSIDAQWLNIKITSQLSEEHIRYYGEFDGCHVLLQKSPQNAGGNKTVADKTFESSSEITLWAYYQGKLYTLEDAYAKGYISQFNVGVSATRHNDVEEYINYLKNFA